MLSQARKKQLAIYIPLLHIVVLGALLRNDKLFDKSLWMDELFSAWASDPENSLSVVFHRTVEDVHPPLYQLLLWLVYKVFGYGEMVGRVFSMVLGIAVIPAMYALGVKLFNSSVGLLVAFLAAVNFHLIVLSQNTRSYELLVLLTICSFIVFVEFLRKVNIASALVYALVSAALVNTHYFGFLLVLSQAVLLLHASLRRGPDYRLLLLGGMAGGIILLLFVPTLGYMLDNFKNTHTWIQKPGKEFVVDTLVLPFGDLSIALVCLMFLLVGLTALVRRPDHRGSLGILLCWWLFGFSVAYVRTMFYTPILSLRNTVVFVPAMLLLVAYGLAIVKDLFSRCVVLVFIALVSVSYLSQPDLTGGLSIEHDLRSPTLKVIKGNRDIPVFARWDTEHITYSKLLGSPIEVGNIDVIETRLESGQAPLCFYVIADQWNREIINNYPARFRVSLIDTAEFKNSAVLEFCSSASSLRRP